mmetsp:Transcript_3674/g.10454  ORF Transcript_3674/g.10454 Transcript_3674/m.10454 type:complete len:277 (+) Transcript_3674:277-1107(+)
MGGGHRTCKRWRRSVRRGCRSDERPSHGQGQRGWFGELAQVRVLPGRLPEERPAQSFEEAGEVPAVRERLLQGRGGPEQPRGRGVLHRFDHQGRPEEQGPGPGGGSGDEKVFRELLRRQRSLSLQVFRRPRGLRRPENRGDAVALRQSRPHHPLQLPLGDPGPPAHGSPFHGEQARAEGGHQSLGGDGRVSQAPEPLRHAAGRPLLHQLRRGDHARASDAVGPEEHALHGKLPGRGTPCQGFERQDQAGGRRVRLEDPWARRPPKVGGHQVHRREG